MFQSPIQTRNIVVMSESVTLLVACLYAEAVEATMSLAGLPASIPELISILGHINSDARL
jgi:hypothetical protein